MYRTEQWLADEKNRGGMLTIPIVIPSYHRPDAPIFTKKNTPYTCGMIPKDTVFIVVRPEDYKSYEHLSDKATLVTLDGMHNVASTRQKIIEHFYSIGYSHIFMLDDRVTKVEHLCPRQSRTGKTYMQTNPNTNNLDAMLIWQHIIQKYPVTTSGISHKGLSWAPQYIDRPYYINSSDASSVCYSVYLPDLFKFGIRFDDRMIVEDGPFFWSILEKGLPTIHISDLHYDEVPSEKIDHGGCHEYNQTLVERSAARLECLRNSRFGALEGKGWRITKNGEYYVTKYPYWVNIYRERGLKKDMIDELVKEK